MQAVVQMSPALSNELEFLRHWQLGSQEGNAFLHGRETETWSDQYEKDFVVLEKSSEEKSPMEKWLSPALLHWYEKTWGTPARMVSFV